MGIFSLRPAGRFLDGVSGDIVERQAAVLLRAFFEAMKTRTIHLVTDTSHILVDLVEKETGTPFVSSPVVGGEGGKREQVLSPESAVHVCAPRLREFPQLPNISGGISFGLGEAPESPSNSWQLLFHRGPLPLLSLEISDESAFKPPKGWEQALVNDGAHFVQTRAGEYFGTASSIYLVKKRQKLFPHSKGASTDDALKGGRYLQQLCSVVWGERAETTKSYRLSSWKGTQKRFMKSFDEALIRKAGAEDLNRVLEAMGAHLQEWLRASD